MVLLNLVYSMIIVAACGFIYWFHDYYEVDGIPLIVCATIFLTFFMTLGDLVTDYIIKLFNRESMQQD